MDARERVAGFVAGGYGRVVGAVAVVAGSTAAAEDAVQEALVRAWERLERGQDIESLPGWVATAAMNLARSRLRRLGAEARAAARMPIRERAEHPADIDLRRAVRALPRRQREAIVLHYFLDLDVRAVAASMGVHEGTVKTLLHRARSALSQEETIHAER